VDRPFAAAVERTGSSSTQHDRTLPVVEGDHQPHRDRLAVAARQAWSKRIVEQIQR